MKKVYILFIVSFLSMIPVFSGTEMITKSFNLQAGFDSVSEIVVTPVPAQSHSYLVGMPFNIEDIYVQYGNTNNGRLIAYWNLLSNNDFNLKIKAEKLKHESQDSDSLDYILTFEYKLGYYSSEGNINSRTGDLVYNTEENSSADGIETQYMEYTDITQGISFQDGSFIGNLDGGIYFMFTDDSTKKIKSATEAELPGGNYVANVWINIEAKEGGGV